MVNATMVQGYFATSLFDTGPEVLEKIFKINVFSLFCYYLPLGKGMALHLSKFEFKALYPRMPSLIKIGPVDLKKDLWMWKVYRQTDGWTDRWRMTARQSEKLTWAFSSGEIKSKALHWANMNPFYQKFVLCSCNWFSCLAVIFTNHKCILTIT